MNLSDPGTSEADGRVGRRRDGFGIAQITEFGAIDRIWRFLNALQSVRDARRLPEVLSQQLASFVKHDGLRYRSPDLELDVIVGRSARHRCSIRLKLEGTPVGELLVYRSERFSEREISALEALLSLTHQSLRSALGTDRGHLVEGCDSITGLRNRAALQDSLDQALTAARHDAGCVAVACMDVDRFSAVNERFGRHAGDLILRRVSDRLSISVGASEHLYRDDGDRFAVVMKRVDARSAGERVWGWLRCIETSPIEFEGLPIPITLSAGVAIAGAYSDAAALLAAAHGALLGAKVAGRNCVKLAPPKALRRHA